MYKVWEEKIYMIREHRMIDKKLNLLVYSKVKELFEKKYNDCLNDFTHMCEDCEKNREKLVKIELYLSELAEEILEEDGII